MVEPVDEVVRAGSSWTLRGDVVSRCPLVHTPVLNTHTHASGGDSRTSKENKYNLSTVLHQESKTSVGLFHIVASI